MNLPNNNQRIFKYPLVQFVFAFAAICFLAGSTNANAPQDFETPFGQLGGLGQGFDNGEDPLSITAGFKVKANTNEAVLEVCAKIAPPWHIFSITQKQGGPTPSTLDVADSDDFSFTGKFEANVDPHIGESLFDVPSEEHEGEVIWSAPIKFAEGVDPTAVEIEISYSGQRCLPLDAGGTCMPIDGVEFVAVYEGEIQEAVAGAKYQPADSAVLLTGTVSRLGGAAPIAPGESVEIKLTAEPQGDYFVYAYESQPTERLSSLPTLFAITKSNGWKSNPPIADADPTQKDEYQVHKQPVTWTVKVDIPTDAEPGDYKLAGLIGLQTCNEIGCLKPTGVGWEVAVPVGSQLASNAVKFTGDKPYPEVASAVVASNEAAAASAGEWSGYSIFTVLPLAFLAGFILNFMPCVLPVIGLKIMSFVHQAGKDPKKVFMLNFVFVLGMLSVFMALATLAVLFGYGWGDLYQNLPFKVTMISVIFVFGLSFFDVWEIPIPGLVHSGGLDQKEGLSGQFFKGIITTLLATPCSGPLLIPAVVWAIAQPPTITYLVFLSLGMGMAIPYLLIGIFPKLASFLPKPGKWMETFKQLMGFVMMGTVIFFLSAVGYKYNTSVLCLLTFLGLACWLVGRIPHDATNASASKSWIFGIVLTLVGVYFSFYMLLPAHELDYKKYSAESLQKYRDSGHTVLVDFTADW